MIEKDNFKEILENIIKNLSNAKIVEKPKVVCLNRKLKDIFENGGIKFPFNINGTTYRYEPLLSDDIILRIFKDHSIEKIKIKYTLE